MDFEYLVIEGNIGVGKTSLVNRLASDTNARVIFEQFADNPFLPRFYEKPEQYAFPLEMSFLAERFHQLKNDLSTPDLFKKSVIADYHISKSMIFASATLEEDVFRVYRKIYNELLQRLPKPNLYVYLHKPVSVLLKNINKRGRNYEQSIRADYLKQIETAYFKYFRQNPAMNVLMIDAGKLDFVGNETDYLIIKERIFTAL